MHAKPFGELADGRSNNYDFLRFLFASMVIFAHCSGFVGFVGHGIDPISWLSLQQTWSGDIAVDGFFAISGCLVTASFIRSKGMLDYFKKRALRIYPGFLVATFICLLIVGPLGATHARQYWAGVHWSHALANAVQLRKIDPVASLTATRSGEPMDSSVQGELDGPMWSIQIEFECYILVALVGALGLLGARRIGTPPQWLSRWIDRIDGRKIVLGLFAVGCAVYVVAAPSYHAVYSFQVQTYHALAPLCAPFVQLQTHFAHSAFGRRALLFSAKNDVYDYARCLTCFLAGTCFYLYRDLIPRSAKLAWAAVAGMAIAILLDHFDIGIPICASYLMFYAAYDARWKLDRWGEKRDLSYGLYLYGWPAQALVVHSLGNNMSTYELFAIAMVIATLCALASWHFVEAPALRFKSAAKKALPAEGSADHLTQREEIIVASSPA